LSKELFDLQHSAFDNVAESAVCWCGRGFTLISVAANTVEHIQEEVEKVSFRTVLVTDTIWL